MNLNQGRGQRSVVNWHGDPMLKGPVMPHSKQDVKRPEKWHEGTVPCGTLVPPLCLRELTPFSGQLWSFLVFL